LNQAQSLDTVPAFTSLELQMHRKCRNTKSRRLGYFHRGGAQPQQPVWISRFSEFSSTWRSPEPRSARVARIAALISYRKQDPAYREIACGNVPSPGFNRLLTLSWYNSDRQRMDVGGPFSPSFDHGRDNVWKL
jgi:hypothetical protein